jgi:serine phosphatase RsbU (regulator of sigma subunit)
VSEFDQRVLEALRSMLRASHVVSPDDLPQLISTAGGHLGAERAVLYLVDYEQVVLVPLQSAATPEPAAAVGIDGTLAGRCFTDVAQHVSRAGQSVSTWTPVLDGTDRLGVLQVELPAGSETDDELLAGCFDVASLVAELTMTRSLCGDAVERTRRRLPMTVPAELQWTQLPPLTCISPRVGISGVLAPAAEVAGDSFDYALNGDTVHVALFDAMGHGMEATLLSAVAVATLRNCRRGGVGLADTVVAVEREISRQFGGDKFVTGIVAELDTRTGWWQWATCGHPSALLVRGGQVVKVLDDVVAPPLGLGLLPDTVPLGEERLEPGDRLVLYSDGVIEARDGAGEFFGLERLADFAARQALEERPVAETLRRLNLSILEHQEGALQDDATTVMVEWLTDEARASTP